jgi:hypothetical protein
LYNMASTFLITDVVTSTGYGGLGLVFIVFHNNNASNTLVIR